MKYRIVFVEWNTLRKKAHKPIILGINVTMKFKKSQSYSFAIIILYIETLLQPFMVLKNCYLAHNLYIFVCRYINHSVIQYIWKSVQIYILYREINRKLYLVYPFFISFFINYDSFI